MTLLGQLKLALLYISELGEYITLNNLVTNRSIGQNPLGFDIDIVDISDQLGKLAFD